jgi:hypothetical protein
MRRRSLGGPIGIIMPLMGLVWFLQGIGVLPGSFMTGSGFWAVARVFAVIVGLAIIGVGVTGKKSIPPQ